MLDSCSLTSCLRLKELAPLVLGVDAAAFSAVCCICVWLRHPPASDPLSEMAAGAVGLNIVMVTMIFDREALTGSTMNSLLHRAERRSGNLLLLGCLGSHHYSDGKRQLEACRHNMRQVKLEKLKL